MRCIMNSGKLHVAKVLEGLGLQDFFEGIICFETLNPPTKSTESNNEGDVSTDISTIPKTPIICKPSKEAMDKAIQLVDGNLYFLMMLRYGFLPPPPFNRSSLFNCH